MKILITGAGSPSAIALEKRLSMSEQNIFLTGRKKSDLTHFFQADLSVYAQVEELLNQIKPDQIYHLAGSYSQDYDTDYKSNVLTSKNIMDCLVKHKQPSRLLLFGSAAEYGLVNDEPVNEQTLLSPVTVYGITKTFQTSLMKFYAQAHEIDVLLARPFNLLGKGFSEKIFIGRIHKQIEKYLNGEIEFLELGNLDSKRDYIQLEDAVSAYLLIMNKGKMGEVYNVGSGYSISMRQLLTELLEGYGLGFDMVRENTFPVGKYNIPNIIADINKLKNLSKE